jgi:hypothetical protein
MRILRCGSPLLERSVFSLLIVVIACFVAGSMTKQMIADGIMNPDGTMVDPRRFD